MLLLQTFFIGIISVLLSVFMFLFGGWSYLLSILVAAMLVDYISGIIASGINGELSSSYGFKRIGRKGLIFAVIAVANFADQLSGSGSTMIRDVVIIFYLINELISIIENAGRAGVPIPQALTDKIKLLKDKTNSNEKE
ncbi:phage holin family protein [Bacillus coahuilensis]|uniref:phage holin family protein n=1 Tax=Bacillus coahuilensis TaxID=408580 RepID=UPI00058B8BA2|nr:phage holin family protein [Bacillus coahuilensis]